MNVWKCDTSAYKLVVIIFNKLITRGLNLCNLVKDAIKRNLYILNNNM